MGIIRNKKQHTITLTHNGESITIMDRNIGAKKVGDYGDILTYDEAMALDVPDGYHIPSKEDWVRLIKLRGDYKGYSYAADGCIEEENVGYEFSKDFKLPFAGYRHYSSSNVRSQGTSACYWSSTAYSINLAYYLYFDSAGLSPQNGYFRAYGFSVRCFKDSPTSDLDLNKNQEDTEQRHDFDIEIERAQKENEILKKKLLLAKLTAENRELKKQIQEFNL